MADAESTAVNSVDLEGYIIRGMNGQSLISNAGSSGGPVQRVLLKDWLTKKLNDQEYTRTRWIDQEMRTFRVPWLHQSHHDFDEEDARIFLDWSKDSGYFKQSESFAQWKTRFRCAMSKSPYVTERKDIPFDDMSGKKLPYKVYQIVDRKGKKSSPTQLKVHANQSSFSPETSAALQSDVLPVMVMNENSDLKEEEVAMVVDENSEHTEDLYCDINVIRDLYPELLTTISVNEHQTMMTGNVPQMPMVSDTALKTPPADTPQIQNFGSKRKSDTYHSIEAQFEERAKVASKESSINDYGQIDIIYFGQTHRATTYRFVEKFELFERSDPNSRYGEVLPRIDEHLRLAKEKDQTKALTILELKNISGGLLLEYDDGDIYATRRCLVQIFYSNFFNQTKSTKLERNVRTLIFDRKEFGKSFQGYNEGCSKMPSNQVYLGFAHQWYFSTNKHPAISAIVKCGRYQDIVDAANMDHEFSGLQISVEPSTEKGYPFKSQDLSLAGAPVGMNNSLALGLAQPPSTTPEEIFNVENTPASGNLTSRVAQEQMMASHGQPSPSGMVMAGMYSQNPASPMMISQQSSPQPL